MGPVITLYDITNTTVVTTWDVGVVQAQIPSASLTINIWNNKGQSAAVSDLKECNITVLDSSGDTANDDVARDKWIQINEPSVDGNTTTWTQIGGSTTKDIKANSGVSGNTISGVANDGNIISSPSNVCTVNFRVVAPINSTPGNKTFKIRLIGYYT
jgi:hypothetical protein